MWQEQRQSLCSTTEMFVQQTQSYSHTASLRWSKSLLICLSMETLEIQHTPVFLIRYVLIARGGKSRGKANILQWKWCTTHREPLSQSCTQVKYKPLNVLILGGSMNPTHYWVFLMNILSIARGGKSRGKAYVQQQKCLHNNQRATLTQLHLVQVDGCQGAHPWRQHASSTLLCSLLII